MDSHKIESLADAGILGIIVLVLVLPFWLLWRFVVWLKMFSD